MPPGQIVLLTIHLRAHHLEDMNYLTTTELRTKSAQLIDFLKRDIDVTLIYRSKIIGRILPQTGDLGLKDLKGFKDLLRKLTPQKLVGPEKRGEIYRRHLRLFW